MATDEQADDGEGAPAVPREERAAQRLSRRHFLGYVLAGPLLVTAAKSEKGLGGAVASAPTPATGQSHPPGPPTPMKPIPSPPQPAEKMDLGDVLILAGLPTDWMIQVQVRRDGQVDFAMPREENGQGLQTGVAMLIADELDVPLDHVHVTLAPADPKLVFNQITGGSSGMRTLYEPVRTAAAVARAELVAAAARRWNVAPTSLTTRDGTVHGPGGRTASYGSLSPLAAAPSTKQVTATPKDPSQYRIVGTRVPQLANRDIVTGKERYAADLDIPGAKPTMVRRPPTQRGTLRSCRNAASVRAMPGVLDVAALPFGVAVRAETFGQAIDAVNAVDATWEPGPVAGEDDASIRRKLRQAAPPAGPSVPGPLPVGARTLQAEFDWAFVNHAPLEPNVAVADVRADRAEVWAPLQNPIVTLQVIAQETGLPQDAVTVHVIRGGGSFGRTLWFDAAKEAALISKAMGKPVKLMWHRTNDMRSGRAHPQAYHRLQATVVGGSVLGYAHQISCVTADINPGLGEIFTAEARKLPFGRRSYDETLFLTTVTCPYNFGAVTETLDEVPLRFWTSSWRSVYDYDTRGAEEMFVDEIARAMGQDPVAFRLAFLKSTRLTTLLKKVAKVGNWGRRMPPGTAQGVSVEPRDKSAGACLVELDASGPGTPRVTKAVIAIDARLPVNPLSIEGQMMGGLSDAISVVFSAGNRIVNGLPIEDGWHQFGWARQGDYPPEVQVFVMPRDDVKPGGIGEIGVPTAVGAIGNAYARATGNSPRQFPLHPVPIGQPVAPGRVATSPANPLPSRHQLYDY